MQKIGQIIEVKEKIGMVSPEKWIVVRSSGDTSALALFNRKDYRAIACLSDTEIEMGIAEGILELTEIFVIKKPKNKKKKVKAV